MVLVLFKMVVVLGRNMIVVNIFGVFVMFVFFVLGGVVFLKGMCFYYVYMFILSFLYIYIKSLIFILLLLK